MHRLILPAIIPFRATTRPASRFRVTLLLPAIILVSFSACNPWQYMTVNSPQLPRNSRNQFVFENDTLRLTYDMGGKDGQVTLRIFNKTNEPLTINWQRSAFIRNQQSISLLDRDVVLHGHTVQYSRYHRDFVASMILPDSVGFVPPGSEISSDLPTLASTGPLQLYLADSLPEKTLIPVSSFNYVKYRQVHYDEAGSPIRFSTYLTFSIGHDNREFALTNHFYVSDIYLTDGRPEDFSIYHGHGDQIYIRQKTYNTGLAEGGQSTASSNIR